MLTFTSLSRATRNQLIFLFSYSNLITSLLQSAFLRRLLRHRYDVSKNSFFFVFPKAASGTEGQRPRDRSRVLLWRFWCVDVIIRWSHESNGWIAQGYTKVEMLKILCSIEFCLESLRFERCLFCVITIGIFDFFFKS